MEHNNLPVCSRQVALTGPGSRSLKLFRLGSKAFWLSSRLKPQNTARISKHNQYMNEERIILTNLLFPKNTPSRDLLAVH